MLGTLSSAEKKFVRVMKDGTHVSNFDWRRLEVWKEPEEQIKAVSRSVKNTGRFLRNFFKEVAIPNSRTRGIQEPRGPSFFGTLVGDNERARYVQDKKDINYSKKLDELDGFFRNQRRESALASIVAQGFTVEEAPAELGRRGRVGALASIVAQGFTREEAQTILGRRGHDGAIASIVAQGFTKEEAPAELGRRSRVGVIASIMAQGFTREEDPLELSRRQREGVINSIMAQGFTREEAISEWGRRKQDGLRVKCLKAGICTHIGCKEPISSGNLCKEHNRKPEKRDDCIFCNKVLLEKEKRRGVCGKCFNKPERVAARKEKRASIGTCITPGCRYIRFKGREYCRHCMGKH
jgi:hypothetical protein